ncbi:TPA: P-loop NTPase fold protein, partial [Streptococcus suis]
MTDIGKQLVQNLVSLIDLVFNFTVTNEIIIFLYKVLVIIFLILTCIIVTVYLWKKFYPKTDYQVDPEFERIIKNNNLNNIWVLGPWGSGKTKFVKSSLNSLGQKFFYVSLFGLNSRNEVIQEINEQIVNETKLSLLVDLPVIGILFKWLFQINGLSILKNHRKHIIVIDDFERVSNDFLTSNKIQNRHSGNVENNTDLAIYNDVLGVIDYIQQTIGCKVVVISSEENLEKLFTEIIIPKFHPYQYHIKFDVAMINDFPKLFFKKNNPKEVEDFSFIFSSIWNERIKATSLTNYRPIIHELSFLSDESDVRFQISYVLSRLMDCWAVQMPVGSLIPFQFLLDRIKNNRSDTRRYNLIKKIIKEYKFNDGFPYYIKVNSKERIAARFEAKEVLVRNYMRINLGSLKISEDYEFDDDEILLLTSQNPDSQLQTKKIKDWV